MAEAIDTCADEAKLHLMSVIASVEELQNSGSINPTAMLESLHSAFDEMQVVSLAADHVNHSAYTSLDVAARELNSSMHKSR